VARVGPTGVLLGVLLGVPVVVAADDWLTYEQSKHQRLLEAARPLTQLTETR